MGFRFEVTHLTSLEDLARWLADRAAQVEAMPEDDSTQVQAKNDRNQKADKKPLTLTIEKPMIDYLSKIYGNDLDKEDIVRLQRFLGEIDHITVSFKDEDTSDYVLKFKELDKPGLEQWMLDEGYLSGTDATAEKTSVEPWMMDQDYLK